MADRTRPRASDVRYESAVMVSVAEELPAGVLMGSRRSRSAPMVAVPPAWAAAADARIELVFRPLPERKPDATCVPGVAPAPAAVTLGFHPRYLPSTPLVKSLTWPEICQV